MDDRHDRTRCVGVREFRLDRVVYERLEGLAIGRIGVSLSPDCARAGRLPALRVAPAVAVPARKRRRPREDVII
ncbi:hypothetical protein [Haloterrigena salinisoli]|uniref:hypothetical protein n=1 Tax=Haloterrigena salinisoli TaxID=3132747 RepID=UPI0030D03B0A